MTNPGRGGCDRRPAARDSRRRQSARHGQPDRVERDRAEALRPRGRAGRSPRCSSSCGCSFPAKTSRSARPTKPIILSGAVSSNAVSLRAGEIAQASSSKMKVINMLQLPGGQESQQVMLQVRFAEVNRRALTELGVNLLHRTERIQRLDRPLDDAAVRRPEFRYRQCQRRPEQQADVQRLPQSLFVQHEIQRRRGDHGVASRPASFRAWPSRI